MLDAEACGMKGEDHVASAGRAVGEGSICDSQGNHIH